MLLDDLPAGLVPNVQVIDDWTTNRKLALAFEAKVGNGKLFVAARTWKTTWKTTRAACSPGRACWIISPARRFQPKCPVDAATLQRLETLPAK